MQIEEGGEGKGSRETLKDKKVDFYGGLVKKGGKFQGKESIKKLIGNSERRLKSISSTWRGYIHYFSGKAQ